MSDIELTTVTEGSSEPVIEKSEQIENPEKIEKPKTEKKGKYYAPVDLFIALILFVATVAFFWLWMAGPTPTVCPTDGTHCPKCPPTPSCPAQKKCFEDTYTLITTKSKKWNRLNYLNNVPQISTGGQPSSALVSPDSKFALRFYIDSQNFNLVTEDVNHNIVDLFQIPIKNLDPKASYSLLMTNNNYFIIYDVHWIPQHIVKINLPKPTQIILWINMYDSGDVVATLNDKSTVLIYDANNKKTISMTII